MPTPTTLEMPRTLRWNRYVVVFAVYLTKWVEAYVVKDQTSETLARLLVDSVFCEDSKLTFASWGAFLHSVYGSVGLTMCS